MNSISDKEFKTKNANILSRVFAVEDDDTLSPCFTKNMEEKVILYPCYSWLNNDMEDDDEWMLVNAVKIAANKIGDKWLIETMFLLYLVVFFFEFSKVFKRWLPHHFQSSV